MIKCITCQNSNTTLTSYKTDDSYQMICRNCGQIWMEQMIPE